MTEMSDEFKVEFYKEETDQVFIVLLEFTSDEISQNINVASDPLQVLPIANVYGVVSNGVEYQFSEFDIRLPKDDKTGAISAKIIIQNVDQAMIDEVRSITKPLNMTVKIVLSRDPDYIEREYTGFVLTNIQYDAFTIEGDLSMDFWELEPFPSIRFTPSGFPGLH